MTEPVRQGRKNESELDSIVNIKFKTTIIQFHGFMVVFSDSSMSRT